ncbi:hypothetical protein PHYPSEUDO_007310 [Phytophthora pseudosyringae]|uniref:PX domain-containing protein n=1 Tax=Phytophthora pseudosyringae TaxID=221518 RepID=A0A8T1VJJ1_9STRA|nr:hypothetical protein PHYPSEUDO_007310 [Phytophthora pseudosyringae]
MQTPQHAAGAARGRSSCSTPQRRLLTLHEVETVLVSSATSRRQGTTCYTLEVYAGASSPSPSDFDSACSKLGEGARQPAYRVDKTLADFDNLRQALYNASHLAHTSVSCEFCKEMMLYLEMGDKKFGSSVLRLLVGREKIIRSLQQFVDNVLDTLIHFACVEGTPWCSGQVQSHQVVRQFLLPRGPGE